MNAIKYTLFASAFAFSTLANAEFASTDLFEVGDGLSTLHKETGLEWMDLSLTAGMSIANVQNQLDTNYAGWRLPTVAEVEYLFSSQFPNHSENIANNGGAWSQSDSDTYNKVSVFSEFFGYIKTSSTITTLLGLSLNDEQGTRGGYDVLNSGYYKYNDGSERSVVFGLQSNFTSESNANINFSSTSFGVYLVNDGGISINSKENPSINQGALNVPLAYSFLGVAFSLLGGGLLRKTRKI